MQYTRLLCHCYLRLCVRSYKYYRLKEISIFASVGKGNWCKSDTVPAAVSS